VVRDDWAPRLDGDAAPNLARRAQPDAGSLSQLRRILDQGSPLIEAELIDPDGLETAVTQLEAGPSSEDPWSKLVEVITLDQAARAFLG
jgi:hypothetical protein